MRGYHSIFSYVKEMVQEMLMPDRRMFLRKHAEANDQEVHV